MNKHRSHQRDERRQAEYWKQRALEAEARLREMTTARDDWRTLARKRGDMLLNDDYDLAA